MTHESLAQLIAFWAVDGNPVCEEILKKHLTPEDRNNEYALYLNLLEKSKSDVLQKLIEIRKQRFLNDFFLFEFIKSDSRIMIDFISGLFLLYTSEKWYLNQIENIQSPTEGISENHEQQFCDSLINSLNQMIKNGVPLVAYADSVEKNKIDAILSKLFLDQNCIKQVVDFLYDKSGKIVGIRFGV